MKAHPLSLLAPVLVFFLFAACGDDPSIAFNTDGDTEMNGEVSDGAAEGEDGEHAADGDWDFEFTEEWEDECPDTPPWPPGPAPPCRDFDAEPLPPPECWRVFDVPNPQANGSVCNDSEGQPGFCLDGACIPSVLETCWEMHGQCNDYTDTCPEGTLPAVEPLGCGLGVCCLSFSEIPCYQDSGICVPIPPPESSYIPCPDGFSPAMDDDTSCDIVGQLCCIAYHTECLVEGMYGPGDHSMDCCEGLSRISNEYLDAAGECATPDDDSGFWCANCPNWECGPGENPCNCETDCALPGACTNDDECHPDSCWTVGDVPPTYSTCVQVTYTCDHATGDCEMHEEEFEDWTCDLIAGECLPPVPNICESEGTGICVPFGRALCPDGTHANPDPLGCEGTCCLEARCLKLAGYCGIYEGQDCEPGYSGVSGDLGCPGEDRPFCCLPDGTQSICDQQGGYCIGWAPVCPETHYTSWEYPCFYGQCCVPVEQGPCMASGGVCTEPGAPCPEGSYPVDTSDPIWIPLGCPWERMQCCLPEENPCVGLGERGWAFGNDICCPGLDPASVAMVTPAGDCDLIGCECFLCLQIGDGICDAASGENECNSPDCEGPQPMCFDNSDCAPVPCQN